MPNILQQITVFSSRRYNENRDKRPRLAQAYLAIVNKAMDVQLSTGNISDLVDWLSQSYGDANLASATTDLFDHFGAA